MRVTEQTIKFLSEIEHIQTRPGMYVGSTENPRTLVRELVDNAIDEFLNGHASKIEIVTDPAKGVYTVRDNGRGLPLYKVPEFENQRAAKLLFTKLFSGAKFDHAAYKFSSGLHGVGLTVVNALSSKVRVRVHQDTLLYTLDLEDGQVSREVEDRLVVEDIPWWSTEVTCYPNPKYFKSLRSHLDFLPLQLVKGLFPKGEIFVNGEEIHAFDFRKSIDTDLLNNHVFTVNLTLGTIIFEVYFGWAITEHNFTSKGTVNLVSSTGWHERRAATLLGKSLCELAPESISAPEDATYGLRVFTNLFTQEPVFTSQTKERLSYINDEPPGFDKWVLEEFKKCFRANEEATEAVVRKIVAYKKQLAKLSDSELVNSVVRTGNDKRKGRGVGVNIWECSTTKREQAELYIVEGQSAAGHVRKTRNLVTQAVLPLRGKPLNAVVADDLKMILENEEMVSLINCIGAGLSPNVDLSAMRYGKILIAADADADGAQISNLILGALIYLVPEIVYAGKVYEVLSPLYEQEGKYFYALSELNTRKHFERFKGLGSMNPDEVETTIVNPKTRRLRQITLDDRERILAILQSSFEKKRIMLDSGIVKE
jgi:DNA gyrase/topoisomerase IV subunit B